MKDVTVKIRNFVRIVERFGTTVQLAETRDPRSVIHPDECKFYFYESYVGIIGEDEYPFGPELNVSPTYYCAGNYYPNPEHFRTYYMRCYGWTEEQIAEHQNDLVYGEYNKEEYPNGVVTINGQITNPKGGVILQVKETINHEVFPSEETKRMYRSYGD